jgi:hypothetical protein
VKGILQMTIVKKNYHKQAFHPFYIRKNRPLNEKPNEMKMKIPKYFQEFVSTKYAPDRSK